VLLACVDNRQELDQILQASTSNWKEQPSSSQLGTA
jgi:hypothetical protein